MSSKTILTCDIEGCGNTGGVKTLKKEVIFDTEQTEGRRDNPHFTSESVDLCADCLEWMLDHKTYIVASGAQGNNTYRLDKTK